MIRKIEWKIKAGIEVPVRIAFALAIGGENLTVLDLLLLYGIFQKLSRKGAKAPSIFESLGFFATLRLGVILFFGF